tara:strand:- start:549 stop:1559 length:1011 start_codon:yes stop_codon:yes gene_type:complete
VNKGILVIYNTCTINKDVVDVGQLKGWHSDIQSILNQNSKNYKLVISECRGVNKKSFDLDDTLNSFIKDVENNNCIYNIIYDKIPVHATFNHTIKEVVKKLGKFEYYMYISSGISFQDSNLFENIYNFLNHNDDIGRLALSADNDNCFPPKSSPTLPSLSSKAYQMKPGYRLNDHCCVFSNKLYEEYDGKLRPDIYIGNGTEPTFSYLASVVGKKNVIAPFYVCPPLKHTTLQDGKNPGNRNPKWFFTCDGKEEILEFKKFMDENGIFIDYGPEGGNSNTNQFIPDGGHKILSDKFGEDGITVKDKENIFKLLKDNLFVSKDIIDYDNINNELLGI